MNQPTRRSVLSAASAAALAPGLLRASSGNGERIRVGQIGTAHPHASGKMATLRKLSDRFEVVGVVEPDPERRRSAKAQDACRGLPFMEEEALLGADAVRFGAFELSHGATSGGAGAGADRPACRRGGDASASRQAGRRQPERV